jgi:hypothetical protein
VEILRDFLTPINLIIGGLVVLALTLCLMIVGISWQRRALSQFDEGMALSRRGVELGERSNALAEESLRNPREMIQLLRQLANRRWLEQNDST